MIDADAIDKIVDTYIKYGWQLRRLLLTPQLKKSLETSGDRTFNNVEVRDSAVDAAWFSRPPKKGGVAWEIRHLSSVPYALLEKADEFGAGFEDTLASAERRLAEATLKTSALTKPADGRQT